MAERRILLLGDPLLREISKPVRDPLAAGPLLSDLRDTLHGFQRTHGFGRGISAVQIGSLERAIYLEFEGRQHCILNPAYEYRSPEQFELWDDCFSFPGLMVRLRRSVKVNIRFTDDSASQQKLEAEGALSELVQHEMDHLEGVLAVDHAMDANSLCVREEWNRRYR